MFDLPLGAYSKRRKKGMKPTPNPSPPEETAMTTAPHPPLKLDEMEPPKSQIDVPWRFQEWLVYWELEQLVLLPHEIADVEFFFLTLNKLMGVIKAGDEDETLAYAESLGVAAKRFQKIVGKYEIDSANHG